MNETTSTTPETPAEKKLANIVRGQIPVLLVHMIRFGEKGKKEGEIAKTYGTTSGKVADIVKGRNFGYVTEDFVPTEDQKNAALEWLKQVPDYDNVGTDAIANAVQAYPTATEEQAAAFLAARSGARAKNPKPAVEGGEVAPKAPRKAKAPKAPKAEQAEASTADVDALLS